MGLFSRVRRLNGSAPADAAEPNAAQDAAPDDSAAATPTARVNEAPRPAGPGVSSLRDGLQHLYSIRPTRDAFAEEAIKLLAKGAGVKSAALLGYEQRGGRMRLLAHTGIDAEALQILAGDNIVSGWDIPLRSLRNRRINVIEAAHENPFVPKALVALSPRRLTIAAMPFFHAGAPIGVVVFFSPTPRGFADGLLKALSQSLRICALALSELPAASATTPRAQDEEPAGTQPNLLRGLAALKAELARLTGALDEAERQRASEAAERVTAQSFLKAAQERAAELSASSPSCAPPASAFRRSKSRSTTSTAACRRRAKPPMRRRRRSRSCRPPSLSTSSAQRRMPPRWPSSPRCASSSNSNCRRRSTRRASAARKPQRCTRRSRSWRRARHRHRICKLPSPQAKRRRARVKRSSRACARNCALSRSSTRAARPHWRPRSKRVGTDCRRRTACEGTEKVGGARHRATGARRTARATAHTGRRGSDARAGAAGGARSPRCRRPGVGGRRRTHCDAHRRAGSGT